MQYSDISMSVRLESISNAGMNTCSRAESSDVYEQEGTKPVFFATVCL